MVKLLEQLAQDQVAVQIETEKTSKGYHAHHRGAGRRAAGLQKTARGDPPSKEIWRSDVDGASTLVHDIQREIRVTPDLQPDRAADLLTKLASLLGQHCRRTARGGSGVCAGASGAV